MITITVVADTATPLLRGAERQMPFAIARALTWVAEDVKFAQARAVGESFVIREPWVKSPQRWVVTQARKADYPNARAIVALDPQAKFLADFEQGGVRTMRSQPLAIPSRTLRPSFGGKVPRSLTPKNLGILSIRGPAGETILAGRGRRPRGGRSLTKQYFRMRPRLLDARAAGVWQRLGSGKGARRGTDNLAFLWKFVSTVRIPKRLGFLVRAEEVVRRRWPSAMQRSLAQALATAR